MIKKVLLFCVTVFAATASIAAQQSVPESSFSGLFNEKLSEAERKDLSDGKILYRNIGQTKNISLVADNPLAQKCIGVMQKLKPAYLVETIQIRPVKDNPDLPEIMGKALLRVENYIGIPYFSERAEKWYVLYDEATTISTEIDGSETYMRADLTMAPFGKINCDIYSDRTPDSLYYEMINLNNLSYNGKFTCVHEKNLKTAICIFQSGDNWILYGIGGVNAPSVFFLRDRIEVSLVNRIKTFANYFFERY